MPAAALHNLRYLEATVQGWCKEDRGTILDVETYYFFHFFLPQQKLSSYPMVGLSVGTGVKVVTKQVRFLPHEILITCYCTVYVYHP